MGGERLRKAFVQREGYGQFGIVQGSIYQELCVQLAQNLVELDFEGYASYRRSSSR